MKPSPPPAPLDAEAAAAKDLPLKGPLRALFGRLAMPADDWARQRQDRRPSVLVVLLAVAIGLLLLSGGLAVELWRTEADKSLVLGLLLLCLSAVLVIVIVLLHQVRQHLLGPLSQLYAWALRMCDGDFEARLPLEQSGQFAKLTFHINRLSEALDRLANEMDDVVWDQTQRLHEKNESLETLYEVAASINAADPLESVLQRCAETITATFKADETMIELQRGDDGVVQVASAKLNDGSTDGVDPVDSEARIDSATLAATLAYKGEVFGELRVIGGQKVLAAGPETCRLLDNAAQQLGLAIAKSRLDEASLNVKLVRERTHLAHELHDSLAQTLASLRLRMHGLDDRLSQSANADARREFERMQETLDEANIELRELIAHFRAPIGARGLRAALETLLARFRRDSEIALFLQLSDPPLDLSPASEIQVHRIVREALTNVVKHSEAKTARVLVSGGSARCRVLVEDDGKGFVQGVMPSRPGERIGLSVMHDRAKELGGELTIDSEPGEGTRVMLEFDGNAAASDGITVANDAPRSVSVSMQDKTPV